MSYPFVPSYHDYGPRNVTIKPLTVVVHMAEGGGTVGYLAKQNPNGVSVHYVIEYGGRIVQMLHESHVNGSINPRDIRTTNDPPYTFRGETVIYGATAAKRALGIWWEDPNRATIGIEIEGFAKDGPNAAEASALVRLVDDIRTRQLGAPLLGHRDFADYKACPGRLIDWGALGGHARTGGEDDMAQAQITSDTPKLLDIPKGADLLDLDGTTKLADNAFDRTAIKSPYGRGSELRGEVRWLRREFAIDLDGSGPDPRRTVLVWLPISAVHDVPDPSPEPEPATYTVTVGGKEAGTVTLP